MADFVHSLPNGLETQLNELGDNVSGGQLQRISIARGILKLRGLLLLDEATSHIDPINSMLIKQRIYDLCKEKGVIVIDITHNDNELKISDKIFKVDSGAMWSI